MFLFSPVAEFANKKDRQRFRPWMTIGRCGGTCSGEELFSAARIKPVEKSLPIIATAAWSIPKVVVDRFPAGGSGLERYAAVFQGVEVNSTFYRHHRASTFERWANAVPEDFRFAVKLPREITHERRLKDVSGVFQSFLEEISPLNLKLGPLLCQLPPNFAFDGEVAETAFAAMRSVHSGPIALEVRHKSWASDPAMALLDRHRVDRVLADPAVVWQIGDFPEPPRYVRLHGKPKVYYSHYTAAEIEAFLEKLAADSWCVFDNTASGAAAADALTMLDRS
jgi:uncharacterized protein YecE (DUF72 family)